MFKNKNDGNVVYKCTIRLLEDADILECEFQSFHRGSYLVDYICEQMEIKEKDYFGLRYSDANKQRHWLDLAKLIIKQCKDVEPCLFSFRVKFYPADPFRLTGSGRIMLYQQLKRDLRHGRLYCSIGEAAALGSLIVQEELGDYDEDIHIGDYVSSMNLALRQTETLQKKIIDLHKKRKPYQHASVAMDEFMGIARGLETYGIDPHPVKDHRGTQLYIGINYSGISTFVAGKRSQHIRWSEVHKINFEGKMFIAHLSYTDASREPKKHTIGFKCSSHTSCRYLWRCAIEQMLFFTLPNSQHAAVVSGGGFFSWGTKFKYTGRTEREILTESINALREQKITSSGVSNRKANSVPATPSSPEGNLAQIRYSSLPRSAMSEPMGSCHMIGSNGLVPYGNHLNHHHEMGSGCGLQMGCLEPVSEEARFRASSNIDNLLVTGHEESNYYLKTDPIEYAASFKGGGITGHRSQRVEEGNEMGGLYQSTDGIGIIYHTYTQPHDNVMTTTSIINNNNSGGGNQTTSKVSGVPIQQTKTSNHFAPKKNAAPSKQNCAKGVRRFHFIGAFIPSFVFVVIAMTVAAIIIIESDSELFGRIRNMPEMINLRYQYYQPLKEYFLQKFSRNTFQPPNNNH